MNDYKKSVSTFGVTMAVLQVLQGADVSPAVAQCSLSSSKPSKNGTVFADVTGDGKADAIAINEIGIFVSASTGVSFGTTYQWSSAFIGSHFTKFGDVDADGKADVVGDGPLVPQVGHFAMAMKSNGSAFGPAETWGYMGDLTGRRPDMFTVVNVDQHPAADLLLGSNFVWMSSGTGFSWPYYLYNDGYLALGSHLAEVTAPEPSGVRMADVVSVDDSNNLSIFVRPSTGTNVPWSPPNGAWAAGPVGGQRGVFVTDVTGDGKADVVAVDNDRIYVRVKGSNSEYPNLYFSRAAWTTEPYYGDVGTYFADVTGDGRSDAIVVNEQHPLAVRPSTGSSFGPLQWWSTLPFYGNAYCQPYVQ